MGGNHAEIQHETLDPEEYQEDPEEQELAEFENSLVWDILQKNNPDSSMDELQQLADSVRGEAGTDDSGKHKVEWDGVEAPAEYESDEKEFEKQEAAPVEHESEKWVEKEAPEEYESDKTELEKQEEDQMLREEKDIQLDVADEERQLKEMKSMEDMGPEKGEQEKYIHEEAVKTKEQDEEEVNEQ